MNIRKRQEQLTLIAKCLNVVNSCKTHKQATIAQAYVKRLTDYWHYKYTGTFKEATRYLDITTELRRYARDRAHTLLEIELARARYKREHRL